MRDRGHAAVEFGLAAGLLLLPVAIVVLSFGPWSERRVLAEGVAAEAARTAVLRLDLRAGRDVAAEMIANHGLGPGDASLGWCGAPGGPLEGADSGCSLSRGSSVTAVVRVRVPLVPTPWGPVGGLWVVGSHTEPIDLYRSLG